MADEAGVEGSCTGDDGTGVGFTVSLGTGSSRSATEDSSGVALL